MYRREEIVERTSFADGTTECAMSGCCDRSSNTPLTVELPHVGSFEVHLCAVHLSEFDGGCIALEEELEAASSGWA